MFVPFPQNSFLTKEHESLHALTVDKTKKLEEEMEKYENVGKLLQVENDSLHNKNAQSLAQISTLTEDLHQEIDHHESSENALRKLEEALENTHNLLENSQKQAHILKEENESLQHKNDDLEETIANRINITRDLTEKLKINEEKQTQIITSEKGILFVKVANLEGTIEGKDRIITHLKNQAALSLQEIAQLRVSKSISDEPPSPIEPVNPIPKTEPNFYPKTSTSGMPFQLETPPPSHKKIAFPPQVSTFDPDPTKSDYDSDSDCDLDPKICCKNCKSSIQGDIYFNPKLLFPNIWP